MCRRPLGRIVVELVKASGAAARPHANIGVGEGALGRLVRRHVVQIEREVQIDLLLLVLFLASARVLEPHLGHSFTQSCQARI